MLDDRGVSSVEFAIVSSLFFMVVFGLIDIARVWGMHERLRAGVCEGLRVAASKPSRTRASPPSY